MPGYARDLQNPDYAPNYAIMPEHNGEDPKRFAASNLEPRQMLSPNADGCLKLAPSSVCLRTLGAPKRTLQTERRP